MPEEREPYNGDEPMVSLGVLRLPEELLSRVEEYWHAERHPNRMAAVRALIEKGLEGSE